jgi:hypothetical protein
VSRFELLWANPAEMTVATGPIVKAVDVVGHISLRQLTILVDLFLVRSFFKLQKNDSAAALTQQFAFRLMLGSRRWDRQNRRHASLPNGTPMGRNTRLIGLD